MRFMVKLLSPPVTPNYSGTKSHLVDHMSMLYALLKEASFIDTVHILSLHGVVRKVILVFIMVFSEWFRFEIPLLVLQIPVTLTYFV